MGTQEHRTRVVPGTLNPKWNSSMQFTIRDLNQDVLCITVYDRDIYSPNGESTLKIQLSGTEKLFKCIQEFWRSLADS